MGHDDAVEEDYEDLELFIIPTRSPALFPVERQIALLATLSAANHPLSLAEIIERVPRYHEGYSPTENQKVHASAQPKLAVQNDIKSLNAEVQMVSNVAPNGSEARYILNRKNLRAEDVTFTKTESEWLEMACRFLEGDHATLLDQISALTKPGASKAVMFEPKMRIPRVAQELYRAILSCTEVSFRYANILGEVKTYTHFQPWKLHFHKGFFYVQGGFPDSPPTKHYTFHLSRFRSSVSPTKPVLEVLEASLPEISGLQERKHKDFCPPDPIPPINLEVFLPEPLVLAVAPQAATEIRLHSRPKSAKDLPAGMHVPTGWDVVEADPAGYYAWLELCEQFLDEIVVISPPEFANVLLSDAKHLSKKLVTFEAKPSVPEAPAAVSQPTPAKLSRDNAKLLNQRLRAIAKFIARNATDATHPLEVAQIASQFHLDLDQARDFVARIPMIGGGKGETEEILDLDLMALQDDVVEIIGDVPAWVLLNTFPPDEAIGLVLGLETLSRYVPAHTRDIRGAQKKILRLVLQDESLQLVPLGVDVISQSEEEKISLAWDCLEAGRTLQATYTNASNQTRNVTIIPRALLAKMSRVYLWGVEGNRWRTFRLDRMTNLALGKDDIPAKLPRRGRKTGKPVVLRLAHEALAQVDRIEGARILAYHPDSMDVELMVYDAAWLRRTLLSFGQKLLGISSALGCEKVVQQLRQIAEAYVKHQGEVG